MPSGASPLAGPGDSRLADQLPRETAPPSLPLAVEQVEVANAQSSRAAGLHYFVLIECF